MTLHAHRMASMGSAASGGKGKVRQASHAGAWYSGQRRELGAQLAGFLDKAGSGDDVSGRPRAIIGEWGLEVGW